MAFVFSRNFILRQLRDLVLLFLVGFVMTLLAGYTRNWQQFVIIGSLSGTLWIFLWKGNSYLSDRFLDPHWLESPGKTFVIGMIATIIYSAGIVFVIAKAFEWILSINLGGDKQTILSALFVTLAVSSFLHGRSFLQNWRAVAVNAEKLKRESASAKYEALKSQVNPHFLFNSLNALTNLVHQDPDKAVKFIKQLSEVYRYVLDTRDREVVSLSEELPFLESYVYLQRIRFGEKLRIKIDLKPSETKFVTPLALQMLIENAIKHNAVAEDQPLEIHVAESANYFVVRNSLQRKATLHEPSSGVGLDNIRRRYEILSSTPAEVLEHDGYFTVKLPILAGQ